MPNTSPQVIVVGSINTDLVIRSARLPRAGETVLGGEFYSAAGGKGANQAVAAARASVAPVLFVGAVGDDSFGVSALDGFRRENLKLDFLHTIPNEASGIALILVDEQGQNQISVASGANTQLQPQHIDEIPDGIFTAAKVLLCSLETPLETVVHALQRAKRLGLTTLLNPAPADRAVAVREILSLVDVLTPNETEAAILCGDETGDVEGLARTLQERGCRSVIVTCGAKGCVLLEGANVMSIAAHPVTAVDATAAGDAFNGVLAVALAEGRPLPEAVRRANTAAALSVTRRGAQPSLPTLAA
jgi:ribokinase